MPFQKKLTDPRDELPKLDYFIAVERALKPFLAKEPFAKMVLAELGHAKELWKKEMRRIFDEEYEEEIGSAAPPVDLVTMERNLRVSDGILEKLLAKNGKATDVTQVVSRSKGMPTLQFTQALLDVAKTVEVGSVEVFAKEVGGEMNKLATAQRRVAEGGHAAFDQEVATTARSLWITLDTSYDVLGICLRRAGIVYDATYAARPTIKTPLRPTLATVPPGSAPAKRKPAPKKPVKANADSTPAVQTSTPATPNPA